MVDKVAEKSVQRAIEKVTQRTIEKATQQRAHQAELTAKRPEEFKGPTTVHFMVFVVDINDIDDAAQNIMTNVYLRLRWKDTRLVHPGRAPRQIPLEEVWNPRVLLVNQQGLVSRSLSEVVQVQPDGTVTYHQGYTGKIAQRLMLADFPMDAHTFLIQFVAAGFQADELTFMPESLRNVRGGSMAKNLSLADWKILRYKAVVAPYQPIEEINTAAFAFQFQAKRYVGYYLWQIVCRWRW